jgi:hypothetical protein
LNWVKARVVKRRAPAAWARSISSICIACAIY